MKNNMTKKILAVVLSLAFILATFAVATVAASTDNVVVDREDAFALFNSGCTDTWGNGDLYTRYDVTSFDNNGSDIFAEAYDSEDAANTQIGASFTVSAPIDSDVYVTIHAFDVDEESGERDIIYLVDEATGEKVELGYLSGMNEEWNTTSLIVPVEALEVGHTYHFHLYESVWGWIVWVRTVNLIVGGVADLDADFDADITASGEVENIVNIYPEEDGAYVYEFKAVFNDDNVQYGSLFEDVDAVAGGSTTNHTFPLTADAPEGEYTIYLFIKDAETGVIVKVLEDTDTYGAGGHCSHDFSIWYDNEDGETHTGECTKCDATITCSHNWGDWEFNDDNTFFKKGTSTRYCLDCGAYQVEELSHSSVICRIFWPFLNYFVRIFKGIGNIFN